MKYTAIQTIIEAQLQTVPAVPAIQLENTRHKAENLTPWVRTTLLPSQSNNVSLGPDGLIQLQGLMQIDLFYPQDYGTNDSNQMTDAIITAFKRGSILSDADGNKVIIENSWRNPATTLQQFRRVAVMVQWSLYTS